MDKNITFSFEVLGEEFEILATAAYRKNVDADGEYIEVHHVLIDEVRRVIGVTSHAMPVEMSYKIGVFLGYMINDSAVENRIKDEIIDILGETL